MSMKSPRERIKGEEFVWLMSSGLVIGLLMVVALLSLIVMQGFTAFWPQRVIQVTLAETSDKSVGGERVLAGEVRKREVRRDARGERVDLLLYLANRDLYGASFHYVPENDIATTTLPPDVVKIERIDGYAIALFRQLRLADGTEIAAGAPGFADQLGERLRAMAELRERIRGIERGQIGRINARILRYEQKIAAVRRAGRQDEPETLRRIASYQQIVDTETDRYKVLAEEAATLRAQLAAETLTYATVGGTAKTVPVGDVMHYYYPNRLGMVGRVGIFCYKLWEFVSAEPREANTEGGIFPAIFGTFVMTVLMSMAVTPFGVLAAIYLHEYAKQGALVRTVRIAVNNLAGVPSIVFGVFGLGFFVWTMGGWIDGIFFSERASATFGTGGVLWASLTLALLTVPVVIVATEESLAAVPRGVREGSLALGASKWQTIQRVVMPAAAPGIMTGLILAMARGAGEVAPLMLVGVVKLAPTLPINMTYPYLHLDQKFMHLGFHIYDLGFQSPDSDAARPMVYATTFFLIVLVVVLNLAGIIVRERLRRKYRTGAF